MIDFLIKSSISLLALLVFYHLILEKEKMHHFNRFYLLFGILFSFVIPFITIEVIDESTEALTQTNTVITGTATMVIMPETVNYTAIIIWSLYSLITLLLLFRFVRNILKMNSKIKSNSTINYKNAKLVLLEEKTLPHTFLNCIFINETDYRNRKIEAELYTHELIHVNQKHTLDILFIEILKTLFWFNPIFIFYKKAVQLNHEFLADEQVVISHKDVPFYQNLLLTKANENQAFYLASNLNYSVTKKRLIMMTKTISKTKILLYKISILPLFSALIFFMCTKSVAQVKTSNPTEEADQPTKTKTTKVQNNDILNLADVSEKPTFPGGIEKFYQFVGANFKTPSEPNLKGKIYITFIIEKDGSLSEFKILRDIGYGTGAEAIRVLKLSPKWIPGKIDGNPVKVMYSLPITIQSNNSKNVKEENPNTPPKIISQSVETKTIEDNEILSFAEISEKPTFPGGIEKFYQFVGANFKTPSQPNLKGKVYITFIIEKDGSLSNYKTLRDIGYGTGEEAIRVLKLSPKWIPGKIDGNPVKVMYSLPITIQSAN
jgi:beta-lactamase regulating signal transducer with metallopeptidase domain